jgi:hypothetical protein
MYMLTAISLKPFAAIDVEQNLLRNMTIQTCALITGNAIANLSQCNLLALSTLPAPAWIKPIISAP